MSRVKNPQEKKNLSLDRDRRNVYGESDKASRKNVPRSKQRSRMGIRRSARQALAKVRGESDESVATQAEALTRARTILLRRKGFKKVPDKSLRVVVDRQSTKRRENVILKALQAANIPMYKQVGLDAGEFEIFVRSEDASRASKVIQTALLKFI